MKGLISESERTRSSYFRVGKVSIDEKSRWMFITPDGNPFFSLGVGHTTETRGGHTKIEDRSIYHDNYSKEGAGTAQSCSRAGGVAEPHKPYQNEQSLANYQHWLLTKLKYNSVGHGALDSLRKGPTALPYIAVIDVIGPLSWSAKAAAGSLHGDGRQTPKHNHDIFSTEIKQTICERIKEKVNENHNNPFAMGYVLIDLPMWSPTPNKKHLNYTEFIRGKLEENSAGYKTYIKFLVTQYKNKDLATFKQRYSITGALAASITSINDIGFDAQGNVLNTELYTELHKHFKIAGSHPKDDERQADIVADDLLFIKQHIAETYYSFIRATFDDMYLYHALRREATTPEARNSIPNPCHAGWESYKAKQGKQLPTYEKHLLMTGRFMLSKQPTVNTPLDVMKVAAKYVDALAFQPMGTELTNKFTNWYTTDKTKRNLQWHLNLIGNQTGLPIFLADVTTVPSELRTDNDNYQQESVKLTRNYYKLAIKSTYVIGIHRCTLRDYNANICTHSDATCTNTSEIDGRCLEWGVCQTWEDSKKKENCLVVDPTKECTPYNTNRRGLLSPNETLYDTLAQASGSINVNILETIYGQKTNGEPWYDRRPPQSRKLCQMTQCTSTLTTEWSCRP